MGKGKDLSMKMHFFGKEDSEVLSEMRLSQGVYIYGAGDLGRAVKRFLENLKIPVQSFVVDNEYYHTGMKIMPGNDAAIGLREFLDFSKTNVNNYLIWGIASPDKLKNALKQGTISEVWLTYDVCDLWEDHDFAHKHLKEFAQARALFADEISLKTFDGYLKIFDGNPIEDINNIVDGTYFNELTACKREGCFLDCGAFVGDTAQQYAKIYGVEQKIYSFEPDTDNYKKLCENTKELNIVCVNAGCWSENEQLHFDDCGTGSSCISGSGSSVINVVAIDKIVTDVKVAFVKMDIEGSELQALVGMQNIIRRDMPVLAISAYHKQDDLITLPSYIHQFESEAEYYQLYLRHHGCTTSELVVYAIPTKKNRGKS